MLFFVTLKKNNVLDYLTNDSKTQADYFTEYLNFKYTKIPQ